MNIAIIAGNYATAREIQEKYGLNPRIDNIRHFTSRETLLGMNFSGWLVIPETETPILVPVVGNMGRWIRYKLMERLS